MTRVAGDATTFDKSAERVESITISLGSDELEETSFTSLEGGTSLFAQIALGMRAGIIVTRPDLTIVGFNRGAEEMFGFTSSEVIGTSVERLIPPESRGAMEAGLIDFAGNFEVSRGYVSQVTPVMGLRSDGSQFPVEHEYHKLQTEHGPMFAAVVHDVSALYDLIGMLQESKSIEENQRNFISIAAHELRTPMTTILGFTELLLNRQVSDHESRQWLGVMNQESVRLTAIMDDMLSVTRLESGKLTVDISPVDVRDTLNRAIELIGPMSAGHEMVVSTSPNLPDAAADSEKLVQVLYNLLSNAIKYSPGSPRIEIEASPLNNDEGIEIRIRDHGIGIPGEEIEKLFTLFHRVQTPQTRAIRGTGIGLFIVKGLVEAMGGSVGVESEPGMGSTFCVRLPVWDSRSRAESKGDGKYEATGQKGSDR